MKLLTQKTVKNPVNFSGVGLHSGKISNISLKPTEPNSGIIFKRTDLKTNNLIFPNFANVNNTVLNTTISNEYGIKFKKCLDINHINIRIQLLIKSFGEFSIGNQTGANDIIPRYTKSFIVPREKLGCNFINKVKYI